MNHHESATDRAGEPPQTLRTRTHVFHADLGSSDSAPGPHDYFDGALAACKALTAHWYAKKNGIALERVEVQIDRDATEERKGTYTLRLQLAFHGALDDAAREKLYAAVAHCPVHKLMTTTDVVIETAPFTP